MPILSRLLPFTLFFTSLSIYSSSLSHFDGDDEKEPSPPAFTSLNSPLKSYYISWDTLPPLLDDPIQKIENCYIRLAITTESVHNKNKKEALEEDKNNEDNNPQKKWRNTLDYASLYKVTHPLALEDMWKENLPGSSNKKIRHITITGEAGSGKTTLTQRITYRWAKNSLWNDRFDWILTIPLRRIKHMPAKNPWEFVQQALHIPHLPKKYVYRLMANNAAKGLLILDGYDEIHATYTDKNKDNPLAKWLDSCLSNPSLHCILTSRPIPLPLPSARALHVLGFQQADIERYINAYFTALPSKKNNHAQLLTQVLQANENLHLLSHTPIYLRLFCLLARKSSNPNALAKLSLHQLYAQLIGSFLSHAWEKETGVRPHPIEALQRCQMELTFFGSLALSGMRKGEASLSQALQQKALAQVIEAFPRMSDAEPSHELRIRKVGILQGFESQSEADTNLSNAYFPHLTLQEWFAAHYLARSLYQPGTIRCRVSQTILRDDKYTPRYRVMLPFVAGILYEKAFTNADPQGKGLRLFWQLLESPPRELIGLHHLVLRMRCLHACGADTEKMELHDTLRALHKKLLTQSKHWLIALLQQRATHNEEQAISLAPLTQGLTSCHHPLCHPIIEKALIAFIHAYKEKRKGFFTVIIALPQAGVRGKGFSAPMAVKNPLRFSL